MVFWGVCPTSVVHGCRAHVLTRGPAPGQCCCLYAEAGRRSELSHCVRVGRLPYQDPGEVSFTALCLVHRLLSRSLVLPRRFQRVTRKGSNSAFLLGVANGPSASGTDALPWTCSYRHEDTPGRLAGQWHRG